jgi:hypothetical protein
MELAIFDNLPNLLESAGFVFLDEDTSYDIRCWRFERVYGQVRSLVKFEATVDPELKYLRIEFWATRLEMKCKALESDVAFVCEWVTLPGAKRGMMSGIERYLRDLAVRAEKAGISLA